MVEPFVAANIRRDLQDISMEIGWCCSHAVIADLDSRAVEDRRYAVCCEDI